jgi:uncharacterized 2Fe-2S/4Fe-4S cluster protein (DUF4445 family)
MAEHRVTFGTQNEPVTVPTGTLLTEAARLAGIEINQPCGGQGRCGRCVVHVQEGNVRRRSTLRLSESDIEAGYALACQSVVEGDALVTIPAQEQIERRLVTDRTAREVPIPAGYAPEVDQSYQRLHLTLSPPSMDDQTDDWSRLQTALRQQFGITQVRISLELLRKLSPILRQGDWRVTAVLDRGPWPVEGDLPPRLVDLAPDHVPIDQPLWGIAIDIGTTTVSLWLVDLLNGRVHVQVAEYNQQIRRGEDVISRIIYASKNAGADELQTLVLSTIQELIETACKRVQIVPEAIVKAAITGNTTMIHLLLKLPAESIRLMPFIPLANQSPAWRAMEMGLPIHPEATVDCLPGVASYVGADITAGILASGMDDSHTVSLFLDIGTNGEIALGSQDWLVACAASAGPAFEGAGVKDGMRATRGAVEEVWINSETYEPTLRVIGGGLPRGLCGSGLISLLAELFLTGLIDKGGNFNIALPTPRLRHGSSGPEYVIAWADETEHGEVIAITRVDIDNLLRTKAAIFAGISILAARVGLPLEAAERVLIGGSFGKYINVEKAVQIGLLPDMPWENFHFLGNTSIQGAYLGLLDRNARARIQEIAARMTYIELSADNSFYEAFTSALFLPHTDESLFPNVRAVHVGVDDHA